MEELIEVVSRLAFENQQAVYTVVAILVGTALIMYMGEVKRYWRRRFFKKRWGQMTRGERIHYRKMLVADILTEGLEKAEFEGKLTRLEVQNLYRQIGGWLHNGDLTPRMVHPNAIRHHLMKKIYNLPRQAPSIPGPKPGEDMKFIDTSTNVVSMQAARRFGEKALTRKIA